MADVTASTWDQTDADNDTASPSGAPEGMAPSGVNDTIRAMMGAIKRAYVWSNTPTTTAGTSTAYTLSYTVAPAALVDGMLHVVAFNATCGSSPTLNVNSLGATPLHYFTGSTWAVVPSGFIVSDMICPVVYNSGAGTYRILSFPSAAGAVTATGDNTLSGDNNYTGANDFTGGTALVATASAGDSDTSAASTAFVQAAVGKVYIQTFTASGTYTPHAGMVNCVIECVGGGGGGGGVAGDGNAMAGGGGGGGGYSRKVATAADVGASKAVSIGAGGAGGTAGNNNGAAGGNSGVGTLCIANGGAGGQGMGALSDTAQGGLGGVVAAAAGDVIVTGSPGSAGMYIVLASGLGWAGNGGSSHFGGGGLGVMVDGATTAGGAGQVYGGGGAGAASRNDVANAAGGAGADGYVVITEHCNQ